MSDNDATPFLGQPDLSKIFTWTSYYSEKTQPHDVRKDGTVAVIVQRRGQSRANADFAINVSLLNSAAAAVRDGKLTQAYVVQVEGLTVLRSADVETVIKNIGTAEPRDGMFGPYHWLNANFMPVGFSRSVSPYDPW
jgi:hypothetical protein